MKNFKKNSIKESDKTFSRQLFILNLVKELEIRYPKIPIYFAATVYSNTIKDINENLYMTGLALCYSSTRIDNIALIEKNLEKRFRVDSIVNEWYIENQVGQNLLKGIQANYLQPMMMLIEHYKKSGEEEKSQMWKDIALELVNRINNETALETLEKL